MSFSDYYTALFGCEFSPERFEGAIWDSWSTFAPFSLWLEGYCYALPMSMPRNLTSFFFSGLALYILDSFCSRWLSPRDWLDRLLAWLLNISELILSSRFRFFFLKASSQRVIPGMRVGSNLTVKFWDFLTFGKFWAPKTDLASISSLFSGFESILAIAPGDAVRLSSLDLCNLKCLAMSLRLSENRMNSSLSRFSSTSIKLFSIWVMPL